MKQHLRDDEFSSMLAGTSRLEWLRHLEDCAQCERRFDAEKHRIERIRETILVAGARSETYWTAHHARTMAALQAPRRVPISLRWRVATCALALALFSLLLLLRSHPLQPAPPLQSQADEQLLMEVEQAANSDVPDAMAPADVLAEDMEFQANTFQTRAHVRKTGAIGHKW